MRNMKKSSLLKKGSLLGAAFVVAFGINGCSSDDAAVVAPPAETFSPFERIATFDIVLKTDGSGDIDYGETYKKTKAIALTIHNYFEDTDETTFTHDDGSAYPSGWIVAGQEDLTKAYVFDGDPLTADGVLAIPSKDKIDPTLAEPALSDKANKYKVQVLDLCNGYYAKKALGATDIVSGTESKVANGFVHAPALPCEVTVYNDADNIYVDMLNPEAIFTLFFSDTVFGTQMDDTAFADEIQKLPGLVKTELKTIVYAALDGKAAADASYAYTPSSMPMGPAYTMAEIPGVVDASPYDSPYLHFSYMKSDSAVFTPTEVTEVAQTIIDAMSIHGVTLPDARIAGQHVPELETLLSPGSSWRSARAAPLGLPGVGGFKNLIIEACSPKYAAEALGTEADGPGRHHAGALPCEISVTATESSVGGGYDTLVISFLEPGFMFTAMFADAFEDMTQDEMDTYSALPPAVLQDLQAIVNHAVGTDLAAVATYGSLTNGGRLIYDMLP